MILAKLERRGQRTLHLRQVLVLAQELCNPLLRRFDFLPPEARLTNSLFLPDMFYIAGAADPSDHLPTGTINTSIG